MLHRNKERNKFVWQTLLLVPFPSFTFTPTPSHNNRPLWVRASLTSSIHSALTLEYIFAIHFIFYFLFLLFLQQFYVLHFIFYFLFFSQITFPQKINSKIIKITSLYLKELSPPGKLKVFPFVLCPHTTLPLDLLPKEMKKNQVYKSLQVTLCQSRLFACLALRSIETSSVDQGLHLYLRAACTSKTHDKRQMHAASPH